MSRHSSDDEMHQMCEEWMRNLVNEVKQLRRENNSLRAQLALAQKTDTAQPSSKYPTTGTPSTTEIFQALKFVPYQGGSNGSKPQQEYSSKPIVLVRVYTRVEDCVVQSFVSDVSRSYQDYSFQLWNGSTTEYTYDMVIGLACEPISSREWIPGQRPSATELANYVKPGAPVPFLAIIDERLNNPRKFAGFPDHHVVSLRWASLEKVFYPSQPNTQTASWFSEREQSIVIKPAASKEPTRFFGLFSK